MMNAIFSSPALPLWIIALISIAIWLVWGMIWDLWVNRHNLWSRVQIWAFTLTLCVGLLSTALVVMVMWDVWVNNLRMCVG